MSITAQDIFNIAPELTSGVQQQQTITFSADLITGNTISGTVGIGTFSVPFNTSNAQTMTDLATAISGLSGVNSCVVTSAHVLTVVTKPQGTKLAIVCAVTGGASQATVAILQTVAPIAGATTQAQVAAAIVSSGNLINTTVWGALANTGQTYLAAHLLTLSTLKGKTGVASQRVGGLARSYMQQRSIRDQVYFLTSYGMEYLALRDTLVITPLIAQGPCNPVGGTIGGWPWVV